MNEPIAYRVLFKGEIIQEGDEVDSCRDPWRDEPDWKPATAVGQPAPDPQYPAHQIYRRAIWRQEAIAAMLQFRELLEVCNEAATLLNELYYYHGKRPPGFTEKYGDWLTRKAAIAKAEGTPPT